MRFSPRISRYNMINQHKLQTQTITINQSNIEQTNNIENNTTKHRLRAQFVLISC